MPPSAAPRSVSPEMSFEMTARQTLEAWVVNHFEDPAPCDGDATWGALIEAWRASGASDLHVVALVAATNTWTADKSVNSLTVEEYIEGGADVHARDGGGLTPLLFLFKHVAAWLGSNRPGHAAVWRERITVGLLKTVKVLRNDPNFKETSSDFNATAPGGITPLHYAIGLEHAALGEEIVESLLLCGSDPNAALDGDGERPLHLACRRNPHAIAALLRGVDPTLAQRPGASALDGRQRRRLRAEDALPNTRGERALELAVKGRHIEAVDALLEGGADCNRPDDAGTMPLAYALFDQLEWGHGAITRLLKGAGAQTDPRYATPPPPSPDGSESVSTARSSRPSTRDGSRPATRDGSRPHSRGNLA